MATQRLLKGAKTILVILILLLSYHSKIFACSCDEKLTIEEAVKDAKLVIDARALPKSNPNATTNRFYINYSFKGGFQWKDTVNIFSTNSSSTCGFSFEEGGRYIIYAYPIFDKDHSSLIIGYETNICTRTTSYNYDEIDAIKKALIFHGIRKFRVINIDRYSSDAEIQITARDSVTEQNYKVLSPRTNSSNCGQGFKSFPLKEGDNYELTVYPSFDYEDAKTTRYQLSLMHIWQEEPEMTYYAKELIQDRICVSKQE